MKLTYERILIAKAGESNTPISGSFELLPLCNMNCDMCYVRLDRKEMEQQGRLRTADEWIELAEQMLALANVVIIKLSTLLDISMVVGALPNITDVFVTEISGECKDLIIKLKRYKETNSKVLFHSVMVHNDGTADEMKYEVEEEKKAADLLVYGDPKESMYLFEPSPSLMKLGPYKLISQRFGVNPIASSTHVYISADDVLEFPGRRFEIELVTDMSKKGIASVKGLYSRASVVVRNFPLKADELRKRLGLKESSENYVYGVTTSQGTHKLICCKRVG